jgi:hypothetical protein
VIYSVHVVPRVEKQIAVLHRAGKKADLAAQRASGIIGQLQTGLLSLEDNTAMTKHGELRIKGCFKYDLGSGYRLVTLKQGRDLFVLYCGTHDDCNRWIENNRDLCLDQAVLRARSCCIKDRGPAATPPEKEEIEEVAAEVPLPEVDERLLRQIFSGLTKPGPDASCTG